MLFGQSAIAILAPTFLAGASFNAAAIDISSIVQVAPSKCLGLYPNVVTIKDGVYENGITVRSIANVTIDFRGVTVRGQANSSIPTMTIVRNFNNVCLLGGRHWGKQDPQVVPWTIGHQSYGAGMLFKDGAGAITVENAVIENSLQDGITLGGSLASNTTFGIRGVYIKNNSDDALQNDNGKKVLFIEDSLIELKMGLSMRPGADSTVGSFGTFTIPIRHSLFSIICVADDRLDGSCGPDRSASNLFKWSDAAEDVTIEMSDSIVRYEARSGNAWSAMKFLPGTYRNVILVWDPEQSGLKYSGPSMPPGVTFTTDASVWTNAKAKWLQVHGCTSDGNCTFPTHGGQPESLGCYADVNGGDLSNPNHDLNGYVFNSSQMTVTLCTSTCELKGLSYAGARNGRWCFCGNSYDRYGSSNNCTTRCAGDQTQICGGYGANSVYRLP